MVADKATNMLGSAGWESAARLISKRRSDRAMIAIGKMLRAMGEPGAGERLRDLIDTYGASASLLLTAPNPAFNGAAAMLSGLLSAQREEGAKEATLSALESLRTPGGARLAANAIARAIRELGSGLGGAPRVGSPNADQDRNLKTLSHLLPQITAVGRSWERLSVQLFPDNASMELSEKHSTKQERGLEELSAAVSSIAHLAVFDWTGGTAPRDSRLGLKGIRARELAQAVLAGGDRFASSVWSMAQCDLQGKPTSGFSELLVAGLESKILGSDTAVGATGGVESLAAPRPRAL